MVSRTSEEVTSEPVIAENSEPPKTPATPNMWKGASGCCACLEDQHVVERTRDTQGHRVRERTLTERIDQEDGSCYATGKRRSHTDPGSHTQTIREFPLTTHIAEDVIRKWKTTSWKGPPL